MYLEKKNTEKLAFRVPTDLKNKVDLMAIEENATISQILRYALKELMIKNKSK